MSDEKWARIPNTVYDASTLGRIRRGTECERFPGRVLVPGHHSRGYLIHRLRDLEGKTTTRTTSRWVWLAHMGPIPDGYDVDHMDCDKTNNRLSNLRCISHRENIHHMLHRGTSQMNCTPEQVRDIRRQYDTCPNMKQVSRDVGVAYWTVRNILRRGAYTWVV